jgi:hypothetical protein
MSEVIISNEIEDYADCVGMILRNRHHVVIGTIVDLELHITAVYYKRRVVFVLDDGRKAFADETRLARKKFHITETLTKAYAENHDTVIGVKSSAQPTSFAIGKGIYRDGEYVGTVVRRGNDGFGEYVVLNNNMKIHIPSAVEDEILDIEDDEIFDVEEEIISDEVVDDVITDEII